MTLGERFMLWWQGVLCYFGIHDPKITDDRVMGRYVIVCRCCGKNAG